MTAAQGEGAAPAGSEGREPGIGDRERGPGTGTGIGAGTGREPGTRAGPEARAGGGPRGGSRSSVKHLHTEQGCQTGLAGTERFAWCSELKGVEDEERVYL